MARNQVMKFALLGAGLLAACDDAGSDTGNPIDRDDYGEETGNNAYCKENGSTELGVDEASTLGFAAADVLALAGTHEETLRWQTIREGSYAPESGAQSLTLTVTPVGDTAKLVDYEPRDLEIEIGADCVDQLEIEVDVRIVSGGGALDETVRGVLVARQAGLATFSKSIPLEDLEGSLTVSPDDPASGWEARTLDLSVQFSAAAVSGSISTNFEIETNDSAGQSSGPGTLAKFGLEPCAYGVAVPADAEGKASSASTRALLAERTEATLSGTSAETLSIDFEPGSSICQLFEDPYALYSGPAVMIAGTLVVKSQSGTFDARWPVIVRGHPNDAGELEGGVEVRWDDMSQVSGTSLAQRYGITQPSDVGYDGSVLRILDLTLSPDTGWSGALVVEGFTNAVCPQPEPGSNSSPGCPGATFTELARWSVRD